MSYKDRKVLELVLDNKDFQKNIEKSIESLNALNKVIEDMSRNSIFKDVDSSLTKMSENVSKSSNEVQKSINDLSKVKGTEELASKITRSASDIEEANEDISDSMDDMRSDISTINKDISESVEDMGSDVSKALDETSSSFTSADKNIEKSLSSTSEAVTDTTEVVISSQRDITESLDQSYKEFNNFGESVNSSMNDAGRSINVVAECLYETSNLIEKSTPIALAAIDMLNTRMETSGGVANTMANTIHGAFNTMTNMIPEDRISQQLSNIERNTSNTASFIKGLIKNVSDDIYREIMGVVNKSQTLTTQQIPAGFNKYESKLKSVQTIMAATGLSIEDVEGELEKLNWYTDETSANYSDMAANISKFTSVNIPLQDATEAMMGIANWAFVSGANMQQASRAMYNISQAMGTGVMMTRDWMSIENANMATSQFKETVIATAKELYKNGKLETDVIEELGITVETFRDSLSEGWFTKDIMMQSFEYYSEYSNEVKRIQDNVENFSEETLRKFHHFTQATDVMEYLDSIKEEHLKDLTAPFESFQKKAAEYGMSIADTIAILGTSSEEELKKKSEEMGISLEKATVIKSDAAFVELTEQADKLGLSLQYVTELASGSQFLELSEKAFRAGQEYKTFGDVIEATADAVSTKWMNVFQTIFGNFEEAKEIWSALGGVFYDIFATPVDNMLDIVEVWRELGGREKLIEAIANAWDAVNQAIIPVKNAFLEIFPMFKDLDGLGKKLFNFTEGILDFSKGLKIADTSVEELVELLDKTPQEVAELNPSLLPAYLTLKDMQEIFENIFHTLSMVGTVIATVFKSAVRIIDALLPSGTTLMGLFLKITGKGSELAENTDTIAERITRVTDIIVEKIAEVKRFLFGIDGGGRYQKSGGYLDYLWSKIIAFGDGAKNVFSSVVAFINNIRNGDFGPITNTFSSVFETIKGYATTLKEAFATGTLNLPNLFKNWMATIDNLKSKISLFFEVVKENLPTITTLIENFDLKTLISFLSGAFLAKGLKNFFTYFSALKETFTNFDFFKKAITNFEGGLTKLAGTVSMFGTVIRERLGLPTLKNFIAGIGIITGAILALTVSLVLLAGVDTKKLLITLGVVVTALGVIAAIVILLNKTTRTINIFKKESTSLFKRTSDGSKSSANAPAILNVAILFGTIAASLLLLTASIKILGSMDLDKMLQGLFAATVILGAVVLFIKELNKMFGIINVTDATTGAVTSQDNSMGVKKIIALSVFIGGLAASLVVMSATVMLLGSLDIFSLLKGLAGFITILLGISALIEKINMIFKSKDDGTNLSMSAGKLLAAALAIDMISVAVLAMSIPIIALSTLSEVGLLKGIIGFGLIVISIWTLLDRINGTFKTGDNGNNLSMSAGKLLASALAIDMIAGAILVMMIPIMAIASLSETGLLKGLGGFSLIMVSIWTLLDKVNGTFKTGDNGTNLSMSSGKLLATALAIDMISGAILVMTVPIMAISSLSNEGFLKGLGGFAIILFSICALLDKINKIFAKYTVTDTGTGASSVHSNNSPIGRILGAALAIDMLAGAILVMAIPIMMIGNMTDMGFLKGIGGFSLIVVAIWTVLDKINNTFKGNASTGQTVAILLTVAVAINALAAAILIMAIPIKMIGGMNIASWGKGIGGFVIILGAIVGFLALTNKLTLSVGKILLVSLAITLFASSLALMAIPIKILGEMKLEALIQGIVAISVILVEFSLLAVAAAKLSVSVVAVVAVAASLAIIALALIMLSVPIVTLGMINTANLIKGVAAVTVLLLAIAGFVKIVGNNVISLVVTASQLLILGGALLIVVGAVLLLGLLPINILVKGVIAFAAILLILIGVGYLATGAAPGLIALSASILMISVSILVVIGAIYLLVNITPDLLGEWVTSWGEFFSELWTKIKDFFIGYGEYFYDWIHERLDDFKTGWREIKDFFINLKKNWEDGWAAVADWFKGIGNSISDIWTNDIKPNFDLVVGALKAGGDAWQEHWKTKGEELYDNVQNVLGHIKGFNDYLIDDLGKKLTPFFNWIQERFDDWKKGWGAISGWASEVADGAATSWDDFWKNWQTGIDDLSAGMWGWTDDIRREAREKGKEVGTSYSSGYEEGINDAAGVGPATDMVNNTLEATAEAQDSHSPSEKSKALGEDYSAGYAEGISNGSDAAVDNAASMITDVISETKDAFAKADLKEAGGKAIQVFVGNLMNGMDIKTAFDRAFAEFDGKVDLSKAKGLLSKLSDGDLLSGFTDGMMNQLNGSLENSLNNSLNNVDTSKFTETLGSNMGTDLTNSMTDSMKLDNFSNGLTKDLDTSSMSTAGEKYGYDFGKGFTEGETSGLKSGSSNVQNAVESPYKNANTTVSGSSSSSGLVWRGYDEKEGRDLYAPAMEEFRNTLVTPIREGWIWNGWNRKSKSDPLWLPDEKTQAKMDALKKTAEAVKESTDSTAASFEERSKSLKTEGKLLDGIDKESKWLFDDNTMEWTLVDKNGKPITKEDMEGNVSNVTKAGTKIGSKYGVNDSILKNGVWVYDEKNDEWTLFDSKTNKEMLTKTGDEGFIITRKNPELKKSEYAVLKNREDLDMTKGVRKFDYKDSAGLPRMIQDKKGHIYDAYGRKIKGYDNRYALTDKNGNLITGKNGNRIEFEVADDGTLRVLGEYNESAQIMKETAQTCVGLMSMGLGAFAKAFADNPEAAAEILKNGTTSDAVNTAAYAAGNAETTETTTQYSSVQNGDATTTTTTNTKTSTASTSTTSQQTTQDAATVADRALSNLRSMNQTLVQIKGKIDMMQENVRSTNDNTRFINNQLIQISKSESPVILDTQALVGRLLPLINQGLGQYTSLGSRRVTT